MNLRIYYFLFMLICFLSVKSMALEITLPGSIERALEHNEGILAEKDGVSQAEAVLWLQGQVSYLK